MIDKERLDRIASMTAQRMREEGGFSEIDIFISQMLMVKVLEDFGPLTYQPKFILTMRIFFDMIELINQEKKKS